MNIKFTNAILKVISGSAKADAMIIKLSAKLSRTSNYESAVKTLLTDLQIEEDSGIWSKILCLNIPYLATSADGTNLLYNPIDDTVISDSNITLDAGRGMTNTAYGGTTSSHTYSSYTYDKGAIFGILVQVSGKTLGSSAGQTFGLHDNEDSNPKLLTGWDKTGAKVSQVANNTTSVIVSTDSISDFASTPETMVLSSLDSDGKRTLITNEGTASGSFESCSNSLAWKYSEGAMYATYPLVGIAHDISADEAAIISAALKKFVTNAGIVSAN